MKRKVKICFLYALLFSLFCLFFGLFLLYVSLPVHAAESVPGMQIFESVHTEKGSWVQTETYTLNKTAQYNIFMFGDPDHTHSMYIAYVNPDDDLSIAYSSVVKYENTSLDDYVYNTNDSFSKITTLYTLSDGTKIYFGNIGGSDGQKYVYKGNYGLYEVSYDLSKKDGAQQFLEHFYVNKDVTPSKIFGASLDKPDFEDTAYAFTGFTANNKMTATWTGTTARTYLLDQEVEEYVRVNYYFADKEAQDTIKQADAYPDEFATADKTLTIDVSGLKPDDENWFLRYIRITPCYRQAGLGAWGDFYHGEPSYVYFNLDGSIDRIDAPYIKGELSSDMERPVIVLNEAANGNPTESDHSYFEFNNAQSDYFFEMKGRWYTTNDFDLYRDKLVWKYKYSTLLKNNLSTWDSVSDNRSSVGRFQFDVLGKSSWDNLLSSYPVDDRNYIGGSYNLFNKITGYSDALETLKMLLKQPYSLFNGYEVYVRYFRYDENGGIQYSKWTHFYNNLADSDGSSGSRLDDLDNMYSENQSDKGLTDDKLSDLENGGNSRNDLDAVPKNNYDYSSLENATMNFFDLLKNFGTMLGQFPSMVAAVFGFLPPWLIGLIALAIGAVIVCRFIGR